MFAIQLSGQTKTGHFHNYNISDGLSQSSVNQIYQDKKGFIWFSTSDGLNRFDGYQFKVYKYNHSNPNSLSENGIFSILLEDSDNNLWISTSDFAINKFNLPKLKFDRFLTNTTDSFSLKPFLKAIFGFEDKHKNIWISTTAGLNKYNKETNKFKRISSDINNPNSLPDNIVNRYFEDSKGYLWFFTASGLCRYDQNTESIIRYFSIKDKLNTPSSNVPIKMIEDRFKNLWLLTDKGLNLYNHTKNTFTRFDFLQNVNYSENETFYSNLVADYNNDIWVSTNNGLLKFNTRNFKFIVFKHKQNDQTSISANFITKLSIDKAGTIWIGTKNGLNKYNSENSGFTNYYHNSKDSSQNFISNILFDKSGEIWIISNIQNNMGGTLNKLNTFTGQLESYIDDKEENNRSNLRLFNPKIDNAGNLWFGSFGDGVFKYTPKSKNFQIYSYTKYNINSPGGRSVWGMDEDKEGNIWMALYDNGFDKFNPITKQFKHFPPQKISSKIPNYAILSIYCGDNDDIWIATEGAGLIHYFTKTDKFEQFITNKNNLNSISSNSVCRTYLVNNKLWIVTTDAGIDIFDLKTRTFQNLKSRRGDKNSISSNEVWFIFQDSKKELWFSSIHAIDRYIPSTNKFIQYKSKSTDSTGLLAGKALCINEDSEGNIWFGTSSAGLSMYNKKTNKFSHWSESDGLPNNVVYGILEEPKGILWLSTNKGLSKFDIKRNKFTNYGVSYGLQSNEFNQFAYLKTKDHSLYFGGINGFNIFKPDQIEKDTSIIKTALTGFQVFNKEIPIIPPSERYKIKKDDLTKIINNDKGRYLPECITYAKEIEFTYLEKVVTFEFAALNYNNPEKIQYRYKMENFDPDWNYSENRRYATYTNLPAGKYIFKVSACNTDGVWNNRPTEINVIILPPFWFKYWFILLEVLFVIGIIILIIRIRERELTRSRIRLEKKVKSRTQEIAEKNQELEIRNIQILKQKEEIEFQAKQLKVELTLQNKTSEVSLLQSQINPHFLFNTLNNIYSLVYQKTDTAPIAVMKLSEIMRYMLYDASAEKVSLIKEIEYLNSFIELQLLRIKHKEFIEFKIKGKVDGLMISPMLLIPFVENAFKHGLKNLNSPGIIINLTVIERTINFEVINYNKKHELINKDETGGIGLPNIKRRLDLLYCGRYTLDIKQTDEIYHVKLELKVI